MRFLRSLCTSHLTHHKLTFIRFDERAGAVRSAYPIVDAAHDDQSTFPPWALIPFFAFFTPFFAPMAFSFPWLPILIGGYAAIAIAHCLYEVIHAVHHQPYDTWKPRLEHRVFGRAWRWLYGFHQAHHANYKCNLNVAGFFGLPLADLAFGTYRQPSPLLRRRRSGHEGSGPHAQPDAALADRVARSRGVQAPALDGEAAMRGQLMPRGLA